MGRRGKNEGFRLLTALVIAARGKAAEMGPACEAEKAGTLMLGRHQRERGWGQKREKKKMQMGFEISF